MFMADLCYIFIQTSLRDFKASFSLFSRLYFWTACCCKLNSQSSRCRPKCCYNQSEFFFWSIIAVTAKYSIAVAHPHCILKIAQTYKMFDF